MTSASNLKELFELKESWRKQGFVYTNEQRKRYDDLLKSLGSKKNISAVGAAINLNNL